jgi:hypothetical protein
LTLMESQPELERSQPLCGGEVFPVETLLPASAFIAVATAFLGEWFMPNARCMYIAIGFLYPAKVEAYRDGSCRKTISSTMPSEACC